ncbi:MAG: hypothetical protein ACI4JJ_08755 [Huintestinicola sp.]
MADGKYTLDDILNEYSSDKKTEHTSSSMSLDDILAGYAPHDDSSIIAEADRLTAERQQADDEEKKRKQINYEILSGDYERKYMPDELKTSAELAAERSARKSEAFTEAAFTEGEEKVPDAAARSLSEMFNEAAENVPVEKSHNEGGKKKVKIRPVKNSHGASDDFGELKGVHSDDDDSFEKKYGTSPLFISGETDDAKLIDLPFEPDEAIGRSFSEKLEMEDAYSEKYEDKAPKSKGKKVAVQPVSASKAKTAAPVRKEQKDPFDKYSSVDDVDNIISEYESRKGIKNSALRRSDTSPIKGYTDIFNKLLQKESENGDMSETGNSELLESIKKLKKTTPPHAAPIERKTISDIGIDLSDKMLQDTSQIKLDKERTEIEKLNALKERRSAKIKDFVLVGDEEESSPEEINDEENEEVDDFESLVDARSISEHIAEQQSKLTSRLLILIFCFVVSGYIALANDLSLPVIDSFGLINKHTQPDVFLFINSVIGVMAGFFAYQTVSNGMSKIFSLKPDSDSLSSLALISSLVTSMISLANSNMVRGSFVYIYIPVAIGALIFNTIGKLLIIIRTKRSFRFISGDNDRYALFIVDDDDKAQDFTRGSLMDFPVLAAMQKTEVITDFLKTSYAGDSVERFCKIITPIITCAAAVTGVIAGLMARSEHGSLGALCVGLSAFSCCVGMCSCFAMMIVVNMPMNKASKKYNESQGAILGFDSIDEFADTNSIMVDASQLFPAGSVNLKNIKAFPDTSIDEAIVQAASLTSQSGSILKYMFYDIIVGKTEMLNPVESYIYEDSMGLCGWINNKRVLLGNRELMANHSIEGLPSVMKEKEYTDGDKIAVYLSISGQLSAMFIVELTASYQISQSLKELEKNRISVMVRSVDSMISVNRLSEMFGVSPSTFRLIPFRMHPAYEKETEYVAKRPALLACTGKFSAFANLILGSNRLRGTISGGLIMQAAAILLGILLTLTMVLMNSLPELTVTRVLLYNFLFVLLFYIYQAFRKV